MIENGNSNSCHTPGPPGPGNFYSTSPVLVTCVLGGQYHAHLTEEETGSEGSCDSHNDTESCEPLASPRSSRKLQLFGLHQQRFPDPSALLGTEGGPGKTKALILVISEQHLRTDSQCPDLQELKTPQPCDTQDPVFTVKPLSTPGRLKHFTGV